MKKITDPRLYNVQPDHHKAFLAALDLKDENGKQAVKGAALLLLRRVASFKDECYWSNETMAQESSHGLGEKAHRRHERYLEHVGCLSIRYITRNDVTQKRRSVTMPPKGPVMSQRAFNKSLKTRPIDVSSSGGQNDLPPGAILDPTPGVILSGQVVEVDLLNKLKNNHLESSFAVRMPTPSAFEVGRTAGRPVREASPRCKDGFDENDERQESMSEEWDLGISEPLHTKRSMRGKTPKTGKERKIANIAKNNAGHLANPTGGSDNSSHEMRIDKVKTPLPPTGTVTRNRLYNHLIQCYDDAYGEGIAVGMLPRDRSGFDRWIAELRQRFIDTKGVDLNNRELAEYFTWFFSPEKVKARLAATEKYSGNPAMAHFAQLRGHGNVSLFYDKFLRKTKPANPTGETPGMSAARTLNDFIGKAYDAFKRHSDNDFLTIYDMVTYGFVLYAQYLHDEQGLTESECKQRIIDLMGRYLRDPEAKTSKETIDKIMRATATHSSIYEDVEMFKEWQELCPSMIERALEITGGAL